MDTEVSTEATTALVAVMSAEATGVVEVND